MNYLLNPIKFKIDFRQFALQTGPSSQFTETKLMISQK